MKDVVSCAMHSPVHAPMGLHAPKAAAIALSENVRKAKPLKPMLMNNAHQLRPPKPYYYLLQMRLLLPPNGTKTGHKIGTKTTDCVAQPNAWARNSANHTLASKPASP